MNEKYHLKLSKYNLFITTSKPFENIEILDLQNNYVKRITSSSQIHDLDFENVFELDKSNRDMFSAVLLYLNNEIVLIYSHSSYEKESRDGIDLSSEYNLYYLVNLKTSFNEVIFSEKIGNYLGTLVSNLSQSLNVVFFCFENLKVSSVLFEKFIIVVKNVSFQNFHSKIYIENRKFLNLVSDDQIFSIYDINFKEIDMNITFINLICFLKDYDKSIEKLYKLLLTAKELDVKNKLND